MKAKDPSKGKVGRGDQRKEKIKKNEHEQVPSYDASSAI